jgi:hypothetical protein
MATKSTRSGDLIGYARVSKWDQNPDLQVDALTEIGCTRIFTDHASGTRTDRPELAAALDYARPPVGASRCTWPAKMDTKKRWIQRKDGYEDAVLPTGAFAGMPEDALDCRRPLPR